MAGQDPPNGGTLLHVVPVAQTQRQGLWTVTPVSLERGDNRFIATFDLVPVGPSDRDNERLHPELALDAA